MEVALFEDDAWKNFVPISSSRHLSQQLLGTGTILDHLARRFKGREISLVGRAYLARLTSQRTGLRYNDPDTTVLLVNARVNPLSVLARWAELPLGSAVIDREQVALAAVRSRDLQKVRAEDGTLPQKALASLVKGSSRLESPDPILFAYPWDFVEANPGAIRAAAGKKKLAVSPTAEVEDYVSFDTRDGPVIIGDRVRVESFSRISGPCYIGDGTMVHSALLRGGTTVADGCRVGGEIELSIVYRRTTKVHFGFLGHSIIGEWANFAAGAVTSDLKHTFGHVRVDRGGERVDTGLAKVGSFIGDMAKVSIGTMIYGGKTIGVAARAEGLVRKDVPDFVDYSQHGEPGERLDLDKVIEMQVRAKKRRDEVVTPEEKEVIEHLYRAAFPDA